MNSDQIKKVLDDHRLWRNCEGGKKADVGRADLGGADLLGANLVGANFVRADLRYADLGGANLRRTKGIYLLPVQDPRGHCFAHAIETDSGWRIRVGCRNFSIEEAKAHWGKECYSDREQGDMYLYAIEWLEKKLEAKQCTANPSYSKNPALRVYYAKQSV